MNRKIHQKRGAARRILTLIVGVFLIGVSGSAFGLVPDVWDGGGINSSWMTGPNWATNVAPAPGDDLQFPAGAMQMTNFNDFPNLTAFNSIAVQASGYELEGESIALAAGIVDSAAAGNSTVDFSQRLTASQTFQVTNAGAMLTYFGLIAQEDKVLTFDGAGDHLVMGVIQDNAFAGPSGGSVVKNGTGTVRLQQVNGYSGTTTVNAGAFLVNGVQASSPITVAGGVLGGTGSVGQVTATGGAVNPGDGGPGILQAFGNVTFGSGATFAVELNGTSAGSGYDQLSVIVGAVDLGSATLDISLGFVPMVGDAFRIINKSSPGAIVGTFAGLPQGSTVVVGGTQFKIDYTGGTGNDVVLTVSSQVGQRPVPALDRRGIVLAAVLLFAVGVLAQRRSTRRG
jgi:autotransporter-associated beta strand protein